jgi:putative heme-binding domain-containing protein
VAANIDLKPLSPKQRLAALCALREQNTEETQTRLADFLSDTDPGIRLVALKWIGEEGVKSQRAALDRVLTAGPTTSQLFAAYLAAVEKLDHPPRKDKEEWTNEQYVAESLLNESLPIEVRRWALRTLRCDHPAISAKRLREWLSCDDEKMQLEAVRTLRESSVADREQMLWEVVSNKQLPAELRSEAIVGLSPSSAEATNRLLKIAGNGDARIANEALRSLRGTRPHDQQLQQLAKIERDDPTRVDLVRKLINPDKDGDWPAAMNLDAWVARLEGPGDAAAGERIFFHNKSAGCAKCHQVDGRGGKIGPDLTVGARALDRRRLIESILSPSKEIAPQFTVWNLITTDGKSLSGVLLSEHAKDATQTFGDTNGKTFTVKIAEIESRQPQSVSVMPAGLEKLMTTQEFRDLLAFLQRREPLMDANQR